MKYQKLFQAKINFIKTIKRKINVYMTEYLPINHCSVSLIVSRFYFSFIHNLNFIFVSFAIVITILRFQIGNQLLFIKYIIEFQLIFNSTWKIDRWKFTFYFYCYEIVNGINIEKKKLFFSSLHLSLLILVKFICITSYVGIQNMQFAVLQVTTIKCNEQ